MLSRSMPIKAVTLTGGIMAFTVMSAFASPGNMVADRVFGQPVFTSGTPNNGGISASSLFAPYHMAFDSEGRLYVSDTQNNRVLEYDNPLTSQVANRVFGQPDITTGDINHGGISASSLFFPKGVAVDPLGRLYVADSYNSRILEYDTPLTSPVANHVLGQPNFTTNGWHGTTSASLRNPEGIAVDDKGRLWIADSSEQRVTEYDNPLTSPTANRVFGEPDFVTNNGQGGSPSAASLASVFDVALDIGGHLYVGDAGNSRVLEYDNPLTSPLANRVFGEPNFTTNTGGSTATALYAPRGVAVAGSQLFIADSTNNRVLEYDSPLLSQTATRVYGQLGSFTSSVANNGGISASSLATPIGLAVDPTGRLYIADASNSRVLEYNVTCANDVDCNDVSDAVDNCHTGYNSDHEEHGRIHRSGASAGGRCGR